MAAAVVIALKFAAPISYVVDVLFDTVCDALIDALANVIIALPVEEFSC